MTSAQQAGQHGRLTGIVGGGSSLGAGLATLTDYRRFGTTTVNTIPRLFRFGTVDTHRQVLGLGWGAVGLLMFLLLGLGALLSYPS